MFPNLHLKRYLLQRYRWNCSNVLPNLTLTFTHLPTMCKGCSVHSSSINWGEKVFSLKLAVRFLGKKKKKENTFHQKPKFYIRKMRVALLWPAVNNQSREKFAFFLIRPFRSCRAGMNNKFSSAVLHPISFDFHRKKIIIKKKVIPTKENNNWGAIYYHWEAVNYLLAVCEVFMNLQYRIITILKK